MSLSKKGIILMFSALFAGCFSARYRGPVSDHFDGKRFHGPESAEPKGLLEVLRWKWSSTPAVWEDPVENQGKPSPATQVPMGEAVLTFINHATMLVQLHGLNFLTDPVFSERASPVTFLGPRRVRPPGLALDLLPKIDVVLISHNHYDHLDLKSIRELHAKDAPLFIVPLGDGALLKSIDGIRVKELDWTQSTEIPGGQVQFRPARHWSARGLFDRNQSLWGAYWLEAGGVSLYFAGDTGFSKHFQKLSEEGKRVDLALLPIGAYEPRWFMSEQHMNPVESVQAHLDLKAKTSVGIHFGTWQLTDEAAEAPLADLVTARKAAGVPEGDFVTLLEGETRHFRFK